DPGQPDARASDARLPDDARVATCEPMTRKPPGATATLASGAYTITWTKVSGPLGNVNPLAATAQLTVDTVAGTARYDGGSGPECERPPHGAMNDGCLDVEAGSDGTPMHTEYLLCATKTGVVADIMWCGYPGPPDPRVWRVTGTP